MTASSVIDVWQVELDAEPGSPWDVLSEEELARGARFVAELHRRRFMIGRAVLRRILAARLDVAPVALRFSYGDWGKPALAPSSGQAPLAFNVSHSQGLMLCAVTSDRAVGIDVEREPQSRDLMGIARSCFSPDELASLARLDEAARPRGFVACWTRKEAYIKAVGMGMSIPLAGFSVSLAPGEPPALLHVHDAPDAPDRWSMAAFDPAPGFAAAVVADGQDWSLVRHHW